MPTFLCGECLSEVVSTATVHGAYYCRECGEYRSRAEVVDEDKVVS